MRYSIFPVVYVRVQYLVSRHTEIIAMVSKFEENFWVSRLIVRVWLSYMPRRFVQGEGNHGYEVLLQNMKAGLVASKELAEYVKERQVAAITCIVVI